MDYPHGKHVVRMQRTFLLGSNRFATKYPRHRLTHWRSKKNGGGIRSHCQSSSDLPKTGPKVVDEYNYMNENIWLGAEKTDST